MKKILALLLAVVMCLSLAACGGGETPNTDDNSGMGQGEQLDTESNNTANTENPYANHPLLQFIYGEWEYEGSHKENYPFVKLEVNKDGTCVVDGAAGMWIISDQTSLDGRLYIDVLVDNQVIGSASISIWAGNYGFHVSDIMISPGDNWKHNTAVVADDNDITLTAENWRDYFDLITESTYSENAFGEVESMRIKQYLVPKEEYAANILATDVVYEIERTASEYYIELNPTEKTYKIGEMVQTGEPSASEIRELWCEYETGRYQIEVCTGYIDAKQNLDAESTSSKTVWIVADIEDINMVRIQGNLYLTND